MIIHNSLFQFNHILGFLYIPKNKGNYSHMRATNIMDIIWMKYDDTIEYKCKSKIQSRITTSNQRGSVMETLLMMMTM